LTMSGRMWFNSRRFGAVSSAVEHRLHTAGVTGSNPVLPTSPNKEKRPVQTGLFHFPDDTDYTFHDARSMFLPAAGRAAENVPPDKVVNSSILAKRDSR
jgi:hypothetical protein